MLTANIQGPRSVDATFEGKMLHYGGAAIESAAVNEAGDLVLTTVGGLVVNAGHVEGPAGPEGPAGQIGHTGPAGPQGPRGEIGPQGPVGETGPAGGQGPAGRGISSIEQTTSNTNSGGRNVITCRLTDGVEVQFYIRNGQQGEQGPEGPQGPAGPKGADGVMTFEELTDEQRESLKGDQGPKGDPGPTGHSPSVTASKSGKVTTIKVDGVSIATINDGNEGAQGPAYTLTDSDRQTIVEAVVAALPAAEEGSF